MIQVLCLLAALVFAFLAMAGIASFGVGSVQVHTLPAAFAFIVAALLAGCGLPRKQ